MTKSQELYEWYKERGICVQCGTNTAAPGRARCEECLVKNAESSKKQRERRDSSVRKESHREHIRQLRRERKEKGLCIFCGKPICSKSTVFCIDCYIKNQRNNDKRKSGISRSERPDYGLCYRCGSSVNQGERLCDKCKKQSVENLKYADESEKTIHRRQIIRRQNKLIFNN